MSEDPNERHIRRLLNRGGVDPPEETKRKAPRPHTGSGRDSAGTGTKRKTAEERHYDELMKQRRGER